MFRVFLVTALPPSGNPPFLTCLDAQVNQTVKELNLAENNLGDKGTIALADALKVSFCFVPRMFLVFLVTVPVTHLFYPFGHSGQQDSAKASVGR